ncbi:sulfite exporter TauE/SafE family protein [Hydrocoleum sp. CS-953]|uniref:sulfite exporter TauE/SafE family protein n=1 Tax=Microcoleaceae TaxID=1892252 RepID=UPI000BCC5B4F|nr:sulfite exporter TauE/SafE family protein [Hydrocoleum sp. CS-953]OZH51470.1 permease [Hydrocoleum sp. CS-953]
MKANLKKLVSQRTILISIALVVWSTWLILLGGKEAFSYLLGNWEIALTMIFGSAIAGGTSLGGGAVAFPVFTKVLHISPSDAKIFSLAIQSVGMTSAAVAIFLTGIKVELRVILWGSLGGFLGVFMGSGFLAPLIPPDVIKMSFTVMLTSFAVTLLKLNQQPRELYTAMPIWTVKEQRIWLIAGFLGGMMSGLVGSGIDVFTFSVMVVLFGLCEKVATPTSVILMAVNAIAGFILQVFVFQDFIDPVRSYWFAAIPVVVVGAPLGAIFCNLLRRETIANILIGLIFVEVLSSLLLINLTSIVMYSSLIALVVFSCLNYWMYRTKIYQKNQKECYNYQLSKQESSTSAG